jgi:hypothetical protein
MVLFQAALTHLIAKSADPEGPKTPQVRPFRQHSAQPESGQSSLSKFGERTAANKAAA